MIKTLIVTEGKINAAMNVSPINPGKLLLEGWKYSE